MADDNEQTHINTDRARGGAAPGVTRYVLGASLILVILGFILAYYLNQ